MLLRRAALPSWRPLCCATLRLGVRCATATGPPSPVNVETFTLNEDVVKKDMEALQRWNDLSQTIDASRMGKRYDEVVAAVEKGLEMLGEMGALNAPIQCETLLLLEAAQAHYNMQQFAPALAKAEKAKNSLLTAPPALRDAAQLAEVNQLIAYIHLESGRAEKANDVFTEVLRWIDVDAKSAMPMQAVAAVNMRRSIVTGIGLCYHRLAEKDVASGGDGKDMYGKALDLLIEALNIHIDENDFNSVKSTLSSVLKCFEGVGDAAQAVSTGEKYVSWCRRHNDEEGAAQGAAWLRELHEKYPTAANTTTK
ncbi:hypothetical protein DQ04_01781140 [Trypanosoma grayi]|uniref:hypothetical protein n=1 Tax=Trypanosoma grayi TaxID=71804 RepID=UPI0004F44FE8|nr:hypothetical protein DQ04_01781140 [Trypanosoma grayi]KEG12350.1 hypothetical protein DQ04_01781140 [Trypanosoma grayi]